MKKLVLTLAAALALAAAPRTASAVYTLTLSQTGNNVTLTGSGTLNTTALTQQVSANYSNGYESFIGYASVGANTSNLVAQYSGIAGPANFGSNSKNFYGGGGTGTATGVYANANTLLVPASYVSGSALSGTNTLTNQTFATIGFVPGTYTYTWGTGASADSFIVTSVVPEPSTWAAVAAGAGLLGVVALRRRAA